MPPAPTTLRVRLTEARDQIPLTRAQWNALADRNATSTVFQTWEWFDAWWSSFGADRRLYFLTVHDGDDLIGFAPLMMIRGRLGLRQLEFAGSPNADYQDFVIPDRRSEAVPAICRYLHAERRHWDMLALRNLPAESPTRMELISGFAQLGLGSMDTELIICPSLCIAGHESEVRDLIGRYSVTRKVRQLEQRGQLSFRVLETAEEAQLHLPIFFQQHMQRREAAHVPSQFHDARHREWFQRMAESMGQAGWLHFSTIECGTRQAAYHFGFRFKDALSWYKPSFDHQFAGQSPGTVLIRYLIEDACNRKLRELDFSGGEEPFKDRFSNDRRTNLNLRIFARRSLHLAFTRAAQLRDMAGRAWRATRRSLR